MIEDDASIRSRMIYGEEKYEALRCAHFAVVGLGGVGGIAAMMLARSGVGKLTLIDGDVIEQTNRNRQMGARQDTIGKMKAIVMAHDCEQAFPGVSCYPVAEFLSADSFEKHLVSCNVVVDAIDQIQNKIALIRYCYQQRIPIFSATGAGNRWRAGLLRVGILKETGTDPLCRILRKAFGKEYPSHPVVYSTEIPRKMEGERIIGSTCFVPNTMGILLANMAVIKFLELEES